MKNLLKVLAFALIVVSCEKEVNPPTTSEPQPDCNCDRVVQVWSFNLTTTKYWTYVTINDCTGVQKDGTKYTEVKLNDCL